MACSSCATTAADARAYTRRGIDVILTNCANLLNPTDDVTTDEH